MQRKMGQVEAIKIYGAGASARCFPPIDFVHTIPNYYFMILCIKHAI